MSCLSLLRIKCTAGLLHILLCVQDVEAIDSEDSYVIRCLQDYISEIKDPKCKKQVRGQGTGSHGLALIAQVLRTFVLHFL